MIVDRTSSFSNDSFSENRSIRCLSLSLPGRIRNANGDASAFLVSLRHKRVPYIVEQTLGGLTVFVGGIWIESIEMQESIR